MFIILVNEREQRTYYIQNYFLGLDSENISL